MEVEWRGEDGWLKQRAEGRWTRQDGWTKVSCVGRLKLQQGLASRKAGRQADVR